MAFLGALPKLTERRWQQQLIGTMNRRTGRREGGLLRMLGWGLIFHDEATNAPRRCPACRAEIHLPRNEPGFPDIVTVRGDTVWFIELKAARGKATDAQKSWLEALRGAKTVRVALYRPDDMQAIVEAMR